MNTIYQNAVYSIELGIEDYMANDPKRVLSSIRNFYSGILLLAKEVLIRAAPNADPDLIIASNFSPIPDNMGGANITQRGHATIDFNTIGKRFKDFNINVDISPLRDLGSIRNNIEHKASEHSHDQIKEAIARSFPVMLELFRLADERPEKELESIWEILTSVREAYEYELARCKNSFNAVNWNTNSMESASITCPSCKSELIEQLHPNNTQPQEITAKCLSCSANISAEDLITESLRQLHSISAYHAAMGEGTEPISPCPECSLKTYVTSYNFEDNKF